MWVDCALCCMTICIMARTRAEAFAVLRNNAWKGKPSRMVCWGCASRFTTR